MKCLFFLFVVGPFLLLGCVSGGSTDTPSGGTSGSGSAIAGSGTTTKTQTATRTQSSTQTQTSSQTLTQTSTATATSTSTAAFLDAYPGATWGFSTYKLNSAYQGSWGTVQRQSDNATMAIGFLASGKADTTSFAAFCASTNCYVTSLSDQVNGVNASQGTLSKMPRVIVDANSALSVCPQPGSAMATPYSAAVNTAKIHIFAVARAAYVDSRWNQSGVPSFSVTGNVAKSSSSLSALSSVQGISATNGLWSLPTVPGVVDSSGLLPNACYLSALSGNTGTLSCGGSVVSGTKTGDTLTITNAALTGAWISNGPASSHYATSAYWGAGTGSADDPSPGDWVAPRNGTVGYLSAYQSVLGNGMRGQWGVYDYDTYGTQLDYDGVSMGRLTSTAANITYSTNTGMTLFADANGAENPSQSCFETMVLFPDTQASRVAMANALMSQGNVSFPFAPNTTDGFAMTGIYQPSFPASPTNAFGTHTVGPDARGMSWNMQSGAYTWPSIAYANNINNGSTMWRFIVEPGDSDMNITNAERSEVNATASVAPGQHFSFFYQFQFEQLPDQDGDWCVTGQVHYNNAMGGAAPDLVLMNCKKGSVGQFATQKTVGGNEVDTNCGSALSLVAGVNYAVVIHGYWSSNHTTDTLAIYAGPNGGTLSQVCSVGPSALWDNDTGAYLKAGIYRGYPLANSGTVIERVMNMMSSTTQNAYSSYISSQPALPAHP